MFAYCANGEFTRPRMIMLLNLQFIFRKGHTGAPGCCVRTAVKMFWAARGSFTEKGLEKPGVSSVALPLLGRIRCVFPLRSGTSPRYLLSSSQSTVDYENLVALYGKGIKGEKTGKEEIKVLACNMI